MKKNILLILEILFYFYIAYTSIEIYLDYNEINWWQILSSVIFFIMGVSSLINFIKSKNNPVDK